MFSLLCRPQRNAQQNGGHHRTRRKRGGQRLVTGITAQPGGARSFGVLLPS